MDESPAELEQADAVLAGAPMYNFSVPSTLKVCLDGVLLLGPQEVTRRPRCVRPR